MLMDLLSATQTLKVRVDDDYIDRMHYFVTSNILIVTAILVSFKQFGGKPMECIMPKRFDDSYEDYAENFCWSQKTYHVPFDQAGVPVDETRQQNTVSYYQWVPFFLLFEAACFRLPSILWRYMAGHSGINVHDIVKLAMNPANVEHEIRKQSLQSLTMHLQNALRFHRRLFKRQVQPHRILRPLNLPYTAFFVTFVYIMTKVLYMVNVTLQLYFLNVFVQTDKKSMYGFQAVRQIINGDPWDETGIFPRTTLCDFKVRATGSNVQDYTVQCVLVINMFNEKIFVFLWFWYMALMVLTAISIVYWGIIMLFPCFSRWFISRHLELSEMPFDPKGSEKDVERFVVGYLKVDGVFIIRMINSHAGIIFGTDLVLSLWRAFYGIEQSYRRGKSTDLTPSIKSGDIQAVPSAPELTEKNDNKLNFVRLRNNRRENRDNSLEKSTGAVEKALQENLIPITEINKAIVVPQGNQSEEEDIDAENRSDDDTTPSEESGNPNFHGTPTLARGKSLDTARLIEEGKRQKGPPVAPKSVSMKKTAV